MRQFTDVTQSALSNNLIRKAHRTLAVAIGFLLIGSLSATPQPGAETSSSFPGHDASANPVSPVRKIERRPHDKRRDHRHDRSFRSIDGSGNNLQAPELGAAHTRLRRRVAPDYGDGVSQLAGANRPNPRAISNAVNWHSGVALRNRAKASDFLWQWGQFVDHDIDLTDGTYPPEPANVAIPTGDPQFDPDGTGQEVMPLNRSVYDIETGTGTHNPRQQLNEITTWIDASNVYGSNKERAVELRTNDGSGKLKTSRGDLLPFNVNGFPNAGGNSADLFLAGDVRANEQAALASMHTLFVREHNRLAEKIGRRYRWASGEQIYQVARRIVGAQMQAITYNEFLPVLLGRRALERYRGYKPDVDASITNLFSTASYRFGHSALSPTLLRLNKRGREIPHGHLRLRDAFFAPQRITKEGGIDPLLRGLSKQVCEDVDIHLVDDVRNFLFGPPGSGGFDLATLNIQRGRDHGLPSYNAARIGYGLKPAESFADVSSDPDIQARLASVYATVHDMDAWVGGLAEDRYSGMVGELVFWALKEQFEALRDGDRFWYERTLSRAEMREVTTLAKIIRRNTSIRREIGHNVFLVSRPR